MTVTLLSILVNRCGCRLCALVSLIMQKTSPLLALEARLALTWQMIIAPSTTSYMMLRSMFRYRHSSCWTENYSHTILPSATHPSSTLGWGDTVRVLTIRRWQAATRLTVTACTDQGEVTLKDDRTGARKKMHVDDSALQVIPSILEGI